MQKCINYALRSKSFCVHWHCLVIDENVIQISTRSIHFVHDCMSYTQRHTSKAHHMAWFRMRRTTKRVTEYGMLFMKYFADDEKRFWMQNLRYSAGEAIGADKFPVSLINWWITVWEILRQHVFYLCLRSCSYDLIQYKEDGALIPNHVRHMHIQLFADWQMLNSPLILCEWERISLGYYDFWTSIRSKEQQNTIKSQWAVVYTRVRMSISTLSLVPWKP